MNVAVVGAGPAGLFAAHELAKQGVNVILFNRDIKPGGLAEYGIYPDKLKMKNALRNQFYDFLCHPNITYLGFIKIGEHGDLSIDELWGYGFQAILITAGAQGTKSLQIPGVNLQGVYHAKDLVYHYNKLPPYSQMDFPFGEKVALVGVGNVMTDIAHYLISEKKVPEIIAIARRGPAEIKFNRKEFEYIGGHVDLHDFEEEVERVAPTMQAVGQNPQEALDFVRGAALAGHKFNSPSRFRLRFLTSVRKVLDSGNHSVAELDLEDNTLIRNGADTKSKGLGRFSQLHVDNLIFAIGDQVDERLGLPVHNFAYDKNPDPQYPVDGKSYECYDSEKNKKIEGVFVAGWSRIASQGLVGLARKDGVNGAKAVMMYLESLPSNMTIPRLSLEPLLKKINHPIVTCEKIKLLQAVEAEKGRELGIEDFKFSTNEDMLAAMGFPGY